MVSKFTGIALAGALALVAAPAFAQNANLNPLGLPLVDQLPIVGNGGMMGGMGGLDLDPLHIFTPAAAPAPAAEAAPMMHRHMAMAHHHMMMHHSMMMHHHMMMHHAMMSKKKMMMKKPMADKKAM